VCGLSDQTVRLAPFFATFYEIAKLVINNSGYRPVTITGISMRHFETPEDKFADSVPANAMFNSKEEYDKIPFILKDGEQIELNLSGVLNNLVRDQKGRFVVVVEDVAYFGENAQ